MKKLIFAALVALFITPAHANEIPVKDRCGYKEVLVGLFEVMEKFYPPRYGDKSSFSFDPDTILTREYDSNLNKVVCTAHFILYPDLVDATKKPWALTAHKLGLTQMNKTVVYEMQYVSGSTEQFNVSFQKTYDLKDK